MTGVRCSLAALGGLLALSLSLLACSHPTPSLPFGPSATAAPGIDVAATSREIAISSLAANQDALWEIFHTEDCGQSYDPRIAWNNFALKLQQEYAQLFNEQAAAPLQQALATATARHTAPDKLGGAVNPILTQEVKLVGESLVDHLPDILENNACKADLTTKLGTPLRTFKAPKTCRFVSIPPWTLVPHC